MRTPEEVARELVERWRKQGLDSVAAGEDDIRAMEADIVAMTKRDREEQAAVIRERLGKLPDMWVAHYKKNQFTAGTTILVEDWLERQLKALLEETK